MVRITWEFLADSQGITGCFADKQVVIICSLSDQALYPWFRCHGSDSGWIRGKDNMVIRVNNKKLFGLVI